MNECVFERKTGVLVYLNVRARVLGMYAGLTQTVTTAKSGQSFEQT